MNANMSNNGFRSICVAALMAFGVLSAGSVVATEDVTQGQDVTIIAGEKRTIYEYRQNGSLRIVRIVPDIGRPYYLVPADETRGFGDLERANSLIPRWTIVEF